MAEPLPPELSELEHLLAARGGPAPDANVKLRVLRAVKSELRSSDSWRLWRQHSWRFAAGVAAVVLFWLNLSMFAANHTEWNFNRNDGSHGETLAMAREIRELLPELTEGEALRQAALLQTNARALPIPIVPGQQARWVNAKKLLEE
jgi:hypothetical protein